MFVVEKECSQIRKLVADMERKLNLTASACGASPDLEDLKAVLQTVQAMSSLGDRVASSYSKSGMWANQGYLSGKAAIVHETGLARKNVDISLARGTFLSRYQAAQHALETNAITIDHVSSLIPLAQEKYVEFFVEDADLLIEAATKLSASQFANVVHHWKNKVDSIVDAPSDDYLAFEKRKLFLHELIDGTWFIHGELDGVTGKILNKTLEAISQKLYDKSDATSRMNYAPAQQRADALGYLSQRYVEDKNNSSTLLLNADIVINLNALDPNTTTHAFLKKLTATDTPIGKAHSNKYFEQLLCDCSLQVPVQKQDGSFDLGHKVRTAPWRMKKQLTLKTETCTVPGCCTPSRWCDAHHVKHWIHGGETKIENLALLCRRHHTMVHNDKTFEQKLSNWLQDQSGRIKIGT